jgi:hypothetical protein
MNRHERIGQLMYATIASLASSLLELLSFVVSWTTLDRCSGRLTAIFKAGLKAAAVGYILNIWQGILSP